MGYWDSFRETRGARWLGLGTRKNIGVCLGGGEEFGEDRDHEGSLGEPPEETGRAGVGK